MANVKIKNVKYYLKDLKNSNYSIFRIKENKPKTVIKEVLPFRIKFINVGIPSYGAGNVPPIGIAIIGVNNYIL